MPLRAKRGATLREKRKAELHAGVDERMGKLKEKLHVS